MEMVRLAELAKTPFPFGELVLFNKANEQRLVNHDESIQVIVFASSADYAFSSIAASCREAAAALDSRAIVVLLDVDALAIPAMLERFAVDRNRLPTITIASFMRSRLDVFKAPRPTGEEEADVNAVSAARIMRVVELCVLARARSTCVPLTRSCVSVSLCVCLCVSVSLCLCVSMCVCASVWLWSAGTRRSGYRGLRRLRSSRRSRCATTTGLCGPSTSWAWHPWCTTTSAWWSSHLGWEDFRD
jgi:hypothetical protein